MGHFGRNAIRNGRTTSPNPSIHRGQAELVVLKVASQGADQHRYRATAGCPAIRGHLKGNPDCLYLGSVGIFCSGLTWPGFCSRMPAEVLNGTSQSLRHR